MAGPFHTAELLGQSVRVTYSNVNPRGANYTRMGFNTFHRTKNFVLQILTHAKCLSMVVI